VVLSAAGVGWRAGGGKKQGPETTEAYGVASRAGVVFLGAWSRETALR
jgi:hypothetical protein